MLLEKLEGRDNKVTEVLSLALAVVDLIALVQVLRLEEVHDGEDLTVVRHEGFTDRVTALDEGLENVERSRDNVGVASVQRSYKSENERGCVVLILISR